MKGLIKKFVAGFMLVCFLGLIANLNVRAAYVNAYTITANPGEDASTMMNINWHTDLGVGSGVVLYTKKTDTAWANSKEVAAVSETTDVYDGTHSAKSVGGQLPDQVKMMRWSVTLKNLEKDTEYMYKVGSLVMSEVRYFKTAGAEEFSFAWVSDFHTYSPSQGRLTSVMNMVSTLINYDKSTDFILSTGDDVAYGASYAFWHDMYEQAHVKNYMWASTIGNHDHMNNTGTKNSNEYFRLAHNFPTNGYEGEKGVSYWFIYGNTLFFFLNNETLGSGDTNSQVVKAIEWMREVIALHPTQYIIVSEHYQWFNGITGASNTGYTRFRNFFDEVGVDLAISGNNHIYLRTKLLYQGKESTERHKGTVYIQAPSSDNDRGQAMNETVSSNGDIIEYRFTEGAYTVGGSNVNVPPTGIWVTLLDRNGQIKDQVFIAAKRNNFDISGFDKEDFLNKLIIQKSNLSSTAIVIEIDKSGADYLEAIEFRNSLNEVLATSEFKNLKLSLSDFPANQTQTLKVILYYKNFTSEVIDYKISLYDEVTFGKFDIKVQENNFLYEWECSSNEVAKYNVLVDSILYQETTQKSIAIPKDYVRGNKMITIQALDTTGGVIAVASKKYSNYGDVNSDGLIDKKDVQAIQKYMLGYEDILIDFELSDCNHDGIIDLIDATIIMMYCDSIISSIAKKSYQISFDYGDSVKTVITEEGKIPVAPNVEDYPTFSGFNKTLQPAYCNDTYYAMYETVPVRINITGSATAKVSEKLTFQATVQPNTAIASVTWSTSDPEIATVDQKGVVTFLKPGTVKIIATSNIKAEVNGEYTVTVTN